ncbi:hypothetical protein Ddc_21281 [Ditylenchus destructor]|nr:hypothetical protein Ddc_21281 [Ditylenchus destructor]
MATARRRTRAVQVELQIAQRGVHVVPRLQRLGQEAQRAGLQRALARFVGGDHAYRQVAGVGIRLQPVQHAPALHVGQEDVQRDQRRPELLRHGQRAGAGGRHQALHAGLPRRFQQHAGEGEVVLDDEQHPVAGDDVLAVVLGDVGEDDAVRRRVQRLRSCRRAVAGCVDCAAAHSAAADRA